MGRTPGAKNKPKDPPRETIVTPIITVSGETHVFEDFEKEDALPVLKSVGFGKINPDSRDFVSYIITSRGREILNIEVSEPNLKTIAIDEAKTSFVSCFMNDDGAL